MSAALVAPGSAEALVPGEAKATKSMGTLGSLSGFWRILRGLCRVHVDAKNQGVGLILDQ